MFLFIVGFIVWCLGLGCGFVIKSVCLRRLGGLGDMDIVIVVVVVFW